MRTYISGIPNGRLVITIVRDNSGNLEAATKTSL